MDKKEQRGLVIAALAKIVLHNGLWVVPSQTTAAKSYFVNLEKGTCTCPNYAECQQDCKHIHAARIVARRDHGAKAIPEGTESIAIEEKKKAAPRNWPAINLAQTTEKHRFQILLHDLSRGVITPPNKGRPRVPLSDVVFAAVYKVYSTLSSRRFMCDLKDAVTKGYISRPLHYNSICAYLESEPLTKVLNDCSQLTNTLPLLQSPTDFP